MRFFIRGMGYMKTIKLVLIKNKVDTLEFPNKILYHFLLAQETTKRF